MNKQELMTLDNTAINLGIVEKALDLVVHRQVAMEDVLLTILEALPTTEIVRNNTLIMNALLKLEKGLDQ
ncbi:MAG: hypothetical protein ACE5HR_00425 [bacterium]